MKKLILLVMTAVLISSCDGAPNPNSWGLEQPEHAYEVDAWGSNPDLLEFTPKTNPGYFCVLAVSGADELKAIFCMPKPSEDAVIER
jgi:hypothetical protein